MSPRLLLLTLAIVVNAQLCYRPDGSSADQRYAPCMAGQYSMCCRINDTVYPDTCRPDGLCQSSINPAYVWRESCTDREWKAPECLRLCIDGSEAKNDMLITFCADQSVCCNYPNLKCCNQGRGVWINDGTVVTTMPAPTSQSLTTLSAPSASATISRSPNSTPPSFRLALEITLPILTFVLLSLCLCLYRRRSSSKRSASPSHVLSPQEQHQQQQQQQQQQQKQQQQPDTTTEIQGSGLYEMDTAGRESGATREGELQATLASWVRWRRWGLWFGTKSRARGV